MCLCAGQAFGLSLHDEDLCGCELEITHMLADQLHKVTVDLFILSVTSHFLT